MEEKSISRVRSPIFVEIKVFLILDQDYFIKSNYFDELQDTWKNL